MPDPITPEVLARGSELAEVATKPPVVHWSYEGDRDGPHRASLCQSKLRPSGEVDYTSSEHKCIGEVRGDSEEQVCVDAEYLAWCWNNAPALIARVRSDGERIAALEAEVAGLKEDRKRFCWDDCDDQPLAEDEEIKATFPTRSGHHDIYGEAMRMVGAKRSKLALIELVNWLLLGRHHATARVKELEAELQRAREDRDEEKTIGDCLRADLVSADQSVRMARDAERDAIIAYLSVSSSVELAHARDAIASNAHRVPK